MPQTINGVGTTYYGRTNVRERLGVCESCGRGATLSSYDTRYWFVVVFIPVIPLGKKRIIDQCSSCRVHRVLPLKDWEAARSKAMEEGMRKVVEQPNDLKPLTDLHGTCLLFGEWDKADQLEERIAKQFPDDPQAHLHLASANAYRGRMDRVQSSLARAREIDPTIEQAAPTRGPSAAAPAGGGRGKKVLWGIVGVLVLAGFIVADRNKVSHRTLHVVNGYSAPVTVSIPGAGEVLVAPQSRREIELGEGSYTARVTGAVTADIPFEVSSFLFVRVFDHRVFVLNPGGVAFLVREETVYSIGGSGSDSDRGSYAVHYGKPFETFDDIDFLFKDFPREIQMKSSDRKRRTRLEHFTKPPLTAYYALKEDGRASEALALAEWAIDAHPRRAEFLSQYVEAAGEPGLQNRVLATLRSRTSRRPVEIALHRAYQDLARHADPRAVDAEYEGALQAEPGNSALLYLRGRLAPGLRASAGYFDRAIAADPKNAWAHFAVAYGKSSQGLWTEALAANETACALDPENVGFRDQLFEIRLGLGQLEPLEKELREQARREKHTVVQTDFRLAVITARLRNLPSALEVCEDFRRHHVGPQAKPYQYFAQMLRCAATYAAGAFDELEAEAAKGEKDSLKPYRVFSLIERGRVEEAEALLGPEWDADAYSLLGRSIAWSLKGNAATAEERRTKAIGVLKTAMPAAARVLTGEAPSLEDALDLEIQPEEKAILLTVVAMTRPGAAAQFRPRAESLNTALVYPRHLLRRALATLGK